MKLSNSWREIATVLHQQARPTPEFFVLSGIAAFICTMGLMMNNGAAVVGAVLIAPLMGPILGIGFSTLTGRRKSTFGAAVTLILGILLILLVSFLISLPFVNVGITEEMQNRTQPTLLNLFIAFPAGFLAGYTRIRRSLSDKIYGVAMSVALLPPLCISGIALAHSDWSLLEGALLMFISNFTGVLFSSILAFAISDFTRIQRKHFRRLTLLGIVILLLSIPLTLSLYEVGETNRLQQVVLAVFAQKKSLFPHPEIADLDIELLDQPVSVEVTMRSSSDEELTQAHIDAIQADILHAFGQPVQLTLHLIPAKTFHGTP